MAKKRTRQSHSGSIYQDRGSWFAAVMVNGKRRKVRCSSKAEANAARTELCRLAQAGSTLTPSTFGVFQLRWLDHIRANKSTNTADSYSYAMKHFTSLEDIPLEKLTGQAVQTVLDSLSGRTRQQCFDKVKQMLGTAIKWGCLHSSPMVNLDRPSHERAAIDPFELAEIAALIAESKHTRYGAAIHLGFSSGLRGGELWGLKWSDLSGNELTIQRQACETSGKIEIKQTKTTAGTRRILLPDSVLEALDVKRADSVRDGHAGIEWMFPGENGSITRRSNFGFRVWGPLLTNSGIRHRGFHHARHTCATLLLNSGSVPLPVVSKLLGHASPAITLAIYSHVMVTDQARHRNAFDSVLRIG